MAGTPAARSARDPLAVDEVRRGGPDFDRAPLHRRSPLRPDQRRVQVGDVDDERPAELLLAVDERSVLDLQVTAGSAYGGGRGGGLQDLAADQDTGRVERLGVRAERLLAGLPAFAQLV